MKESSESSLPHCNFRRLKVAAVMVLSARVAWACATLASGVVADGVTAVVVVDASLIRLIRSRWPCLGFARNLDMVMTAVAKSIRPNDTVHCRDPIKDWYLWIPSSSNSGVRSSSGWSFGSSGDLYSRGLWPNIRSKLSAIRSTYPRALWHKVPSSSRE